MARQGGAAASSQLSGGEPRARPQRRQEEEGEPAGGGGGRLARERDRVRRTLLRTGSAELLRPDRYPIGRRQDHWPRPMPKLNAPVCVDRVPGLRVDGDDEPQTPRTPEQGGRERSTSARSSASALAAAAAAASSSTGAATAAGAAARSGAEAQPVELVGWGAAVHGRYRPARWLALTL